MSRPGETLNPDQIEELLEEWRTAGSAAEAQDAAGRIMAQVPGLLNQARSMAGFRRSHAEMQARCDEALRLAARREAEVARLRDEIGPLRDDNSADRIASLCALAEGARERVRALDEEVGRERAAVEALIAAVADLGAWPASEAMRREGVGADLRTNGSA